MTREEAVGCFALLTAGFPTVSIDTPTAQVYTSALQRYDLDVGKRGVELALEHERFWPSVATLLDRCRDARAELERARPALPEPPVSAEQAAANAARARELSARIGQPIPDELPAVEGDTPEIAAARRRVALRLAAEEARDGH